MSDSYQTIYDAAWSAEPVEVDERYRRNLERQAQSRPQPVAWMDDFGNAFPLGANKGAGSWRDAHKRTWKPLYASPPPREPITRGQLETELGQPYEGEDCAWSLTEIFAALRDLGIEVKP